MKNHAIVVAILVLGIVVQPSGVLWAQAGSAQPSPAQPGQAVLRPGDVLQINVWPDSDLSGEFVIEDSGLVHLPLIESVRAAGVPIDELRADLRRRYAESLQNPVVTVTPMFRVSVTGEVMRPGVHMITPTHELFDVIGLAGGLRPGADAEKLRIVRPGSVVEFDALRALETGEGMNVVQLRSGDHIVIPAMDPPLITWRNTLTFLQVVSLLVLSYERLNRAR